MESFTETKKETIEREVKDQFDQLISAINQLDINTWSEFFSKDEFLSAFASTDFFETKTGWVDSITHNFLMREYQNAEPFEVKITALTPDLALLTSRDKTILQIKGGKSVKFKHVFSMIWKKEQNGWKIIHSHESWIGE